MNLVTSELLMNLPEKKMRSLRPDDIFDSVTYEDKRPDVRVRKYRMQKEYGEKKFIKP